MFIRDPASYFISLLAPNTVFPCGPRQSLWLQLSHSHSNQQEGDQARRKTPFPPSHTTAAKDTSQKCYILFHLTSCWPDLCQTATTSCKGSQKLASFSQCTYAQLISRGSYQIKERRETISHLYQQGKVRKNAFQSVYIYKDIKILDIRVWIFHCHTLIIFNYSLFLYIYLIIQSKYY